MNIARVKTRQPLKNSSRSSRGGLNWRSKAGASPSRPSLVRPNRETFSRSGVDSGATTFGSPDITPQILNNLSPRGFAIAISLGIVSIFLILGLVLSSHLAVAHSYDLSDLTQQKLRLLEVNRQLKTELARTSSLDQLEIAARQNLGLITPIQGQIVVID